MEMGDAKRCVMRDLEKTLKKTNSDFIVFILWGVFILRGVFTLWGVFILWDVFIIILVIKYHLPILTPCVGPVHTPGFGVFS